MELTDRAKKAAKIIVEWWDTGQIPQKIHIFDKRGGHYHIQNGSQVLRDLDLSHMPREAFDELHRANLIKIAPRTAKDNYDVILFQELRDAVESNFGEQQLTLKSLNKTVFISYRRSTSRHLARLVHNYLEQAGYDVFLDVIDLKSGVFDEKLLDEIRQRSHFVVILAKGSLDRVVDKDDWLKKEIETAIEYEKNIVPIQDEDFEYTNEEHLFIGQLAELKRLNAVSYFHVHHESGMDRMLEYLEAYEASQIRKTQIDLSSDVESNTQTLHKIFGVKLQVENDIFMIMPLDDGTMNVYNAHIKPTVNNLGFTIKNVASAFSKGSIVQDVWSRIISARLVIVDLTGRNPSVFYELGIAHTLEKNTLTITRNIEDVPIDIRHQRYIKYETTPRGMQQFEAELKDAIQKILSDA